MTPVERSTYVLRLLKAGPILESDLSKHLLTTDQVRRTIRALVRGGYQIKERQIRKSGDEPAYREYSLKAVPSLSWTSEPLRGPKEIMRA